MLSQHSASDMKWPSLRRVGIRAITVRLFSIGLAEGKQQLASFLGRAILEASEIEDITARQLDLPTIARS